VCVEQDRCPTPTHACLCMAFCQAADVVVILTFGKAAIVMVAVVVVDVVVVVVAALTLGGCSTTHRHVYSVHVTCSDDSCCC